MTPVKQGCNNSNTDGGFAFQFDNSDTQKQTLNNSATRSARMSNY